MSNSCLDIEKLAVVISQESYRTGDDISRKNADFFHIGAELIVSKELLTSITCRIDS